GITREGTGEGVCADLRWGKGVDQRRVGGAGYLVCSRGVGDGNGQLFDLELHPAGEDQRVVGAQRQRPLGDVVQADVRTGITGERAGESVVEDQRRGEGVSQRRVARDVDIRLDSGVADGKG